MIDNFALALSHGLMILAAWRVMNRPDLDKDDVPPPAASRRARHNIAKAGTEARPGA